MHEGVICNTAKAVAVSKCFKVCTLHAKGYTKCVKLAVRDLKTICSQPYNDFQICAHFVHAVWSVSKPETRHKHSTCKVLQLAILPQNHCITTAMLWKLIRWLTSDLIMHGKVHVIITQKINANKNTDLGH